jgi:hypothetical protein
MVIMCHLELQRLFSTVLYVSLFCVGAMGTWSWT